MMTTSTREQEVAFTRYYENRLVRAGAITPEQKLEVVDQLERALLAVECAPLPTSGELEAAFSRYYATRLAQANAKTPEQKMAVLDTLERECLEQGQFPFPSVVLRVEVTHWRLS